MIDLVIVSDAKTEELYRVTHHAITTAEQYAEVPVEVYVVEAHPEAHYPGVTTLQYDFPFGYNKCLNYGASFGKGEYIFFANNDLEFTPGWTDLIKHMQKHRPPLASISPLCPRTGKQYGWAKGAGVKMANLNSGSDETRMLFCGWAFMLRRSAWERIGGLDERRKFWSADNATLMQLKRAKLRHGLDTNCVVHHLESTTLKTLDKETRNDYEWNEIKKYNRDYNKKVFIDKLGGQYNKPK